VLTFVEKLDARVDANFVAGRDQLRELLVGQTVEEAK
jgi:hypothetical protein